MVQGRVSDWRWWIMYCYQTKPMCVRLLGVVCRSPVGGMYDHFLEGVRQKVVGG